MLKFFFLLLLCLSTLVAKIPRHLYVESPSYIGGAGMFHNFNIVLGCLDLYDSNDHIALTIDFKDKGLYYDSVYGPNWWSYYFERTFYPQKIQKNKKALIKFLHDEEKAEIGNAAHFYMTRERANALITRYIQVRKEILQEVEDFYTLFLKGVFVIGIHYRSTDKWLEAVKVSYQEVIAAAEKALTLHQEAKIFVATDEVTFLMKMQERYGDRVYYTKAQRLDEHPIHYASNCNFLKGREAIIDCLLLAKSDILIRTNSNLSAVSAYFNPKMPIVNLNTVNSFLYQGLKSKGEPNELNRFP